MVIIGLNGYAGTGKSAFAGRLICEGYLQAKFAGPFKAGLDAMWGNMGFSEDEIGRMMDGDLKDEHIDVLGGSPRDWMIQVGDGFREQFGPDIWVNALVKKVLRAKADGVERFVVDDVRKPGEATAIRALGGYIVRIERPGVGPKNEQEKSIGLIEDPDIIVTNDDGYEALHRDAIQTAVHVEAAYREKIGAAA